MPGSLVITKAKFLGRVAAQEPEANAKRKATQRVNTQAASLKGASPVALLFSVVPGENLTPWDCSLRILSPFFGSIE
jgi:hypothetical protein